ncbi:MAG: hypothetical protein LH647_08760 [Leptolyngbyaceae cyanobacterium CAN_BIN12]|nr:hypothetical protein [Leptolyngbyaceae cyanobacterium CAN_BIN12]
MAHSILFHELVEYVDELSTDDQEMLFDLIRKRRIEKRRVEIAENAAQALAAVRAGTAKSGSVEDLKADLLRED